MALVTLLEGVLASDRQGCFGQFSVRVQVLKRVYLCFREIFTLSLTLQQLCGFGAETPIQTCESRIVC